LLLQQKNNTAAKSVIDAGLELHPDNLIFVKLKAHLLVDEDKITEAISLLEDAAPPLMDNPDYHAFVAALYQREGKSALAASLYKQLLSLQPSNAKWWVGLGVALDAMGSHSQALEAYTNATNTNGLNPELKAYAESQLAAK
jgi:MSHA biogenesis protein MshN